jgi:transcription elongation factor SPT6
MADLFDEAADVASGEEEEEELDDEGQPIRRSKNVDLNDSSEEEDDDDEEAAREVRDGFIVDEDEDDEEARQRKRERREERRKRRREEAEDDILDDEDLDLIGETHPDREGQQTQKSKYKRLKRGHREERQASEARGVEDIFSDDEDGGEGVGAARSRGAFGAPYGDEMDDFIEEDEFPDDEGERMREDLEIRQPSKGGFTNIENLKEQGLNEGDLEDMRGAFGDGNEFEWALDVEKDLIAKEEGPDRALELKDVFEPSQLVERMLTDEDNTIRITDVPERLQIARKPYKDLSELSEEQMAERMAEESKWIANTMFPQQQLPSSLREPFEQAVSKVLHFMNVEDFEPAFIFQNRKDYLIHSEQVPLPPDPSDPGAPAYEIKAEKLLSQTNLWELMDYDLKYRAFAEKRDGIRNSVEMLKEMFPDFNDSIFDDLMPDAVEIEDLQDLQDYLNFQYSQQLKDLSTVESEANGTQKRARGTRSIWDKVRAGNAYHLVRAFGITADAFAQNVAKIGRKNYTEDPDVRPDDMADTLVQEPEYRTGKEVLASARAMFVEEIASNPRLRKHLRKMYVEYMVFDAVRTDKGLKQIDAEHPYYEFKYLRNQGIRNFFSRPELFLRMLKAEQDGLIEE